jgi:hypothetical protein
VGAKVEVNQHGKGRYYPGVITAVSGGKETATGVETGTGTGSGAGLGRERRSGGSGGSGMGEGLAVTSEVTYEVTYFDEEVEAGVEGRLIRLLAADAGG